MPPSLQVLSAGILFSLGGTLIKLCTFAPLQRAGLRALIAAAALFVLLPAARRLPSRRVLALAPLYFGATVLFVLANTQTTAANAIFLQSTYPFWVTVLGLPMLGERPRRLDVVVLVCIAVGMTLFFVAPATGSATAPDPRLGDVLALVSGVSFGCLLLVFRWLARRGDDEQQAVVAWGNLLAAPAAFALMPLFDQPLTAGDATSWISIATLGVLQVGLANALLVRAMPRVPALQASLLLMIEPALNPLLAYAVHGERPHALAICGGVVILGAVAAASVWSARRRSPPRAVAAP